MIENFFVNERSFIDKLLIWKNKKNSRKNDWIFESVNRNENQLNYNNFYSFNSVYKNSLCQI